MISPSVLRKEQPRTPADAALPNDGVEPKSHQQLSLSCVDNLPSNDFRLGRNQISRKRAGIPTGNAGAMRGFVPTPPEIVDHMVDRLFRGRAPTKTDNLLDPGCGTGVFVAGVLRRCGKQNVPMPSMVGIESEPRRAQIARATFDGVGYVQIRRADFLTGPVESFDFIIGNPPYVAIYAFSDDEKRHYRATYETARGRFDLYLLFFERALRSLKPGGRMVFITPEKFLYVETAAPLRRLLSGVNVEEIELINEQSFGGLVTYPTITTIVNRPPRRVTAVRLRDGSHQRCALDGSASWMPIIRGVAQLQSHPTTLQDICVRVSCGVATGADDVFVRESDSLEAELVNFARATIAGRELTRPGEITHHSHVMLIPYNQRGVLLAERDLGALWRYLLSKQDRLMQRTCVRRKPWYAFHETPPLPHILRPKILCKDITEKPHFWIDRKGSLIPRHSLYYIVPADARSIELLCAYLNSPAATQWLAEHCQRAANGFLRLQSNILKLMPVPDELARSYDRKLLSNQQSHLPVLGDSGGTPAR
jgi:adenine-specific DNA-methyltransferase